MCYKIFVYFTVIAVTSALVRIPIYKSENFRFNTENIQQEKNLLSRKYNKVYIDKNVGLEDLSDVKNLYYYGNISIGTPPQNLTVAFDTASALLWVEETQVCRNLSYYEICPGSPGFQSNLSRTYEAESGSFNISSSSGIFGKDVVSILGLQIQNQTFGIANNISSQYVYQGVFGLGFQALAPDNIVPPLYNMISQGLLEDLVFSFYLATGPANATTTKGGELILGGSDSSLYTGKLTYLPVISDIYWEFQISTINSNGLNLCHNCEAIIDTSTYLICAPTIAYTVLKALFNSTKTQNGLTVVDCSTLTNLPDLEFEINDLKFSLTPADYTTTSIVNYEEHYGDYPDVPFCVTVIENLGHDYWLLGEPFIKKVYTEFNLGKKTIGFASLTGSLSDITTTAAPTTTTALPTKNNACKK